MYRSVYYILRYCTFFSLEAFMNRRKNLDAATAEICGELSELEKKLVESHSIVEIRGKVRTMVSKSPLLLLC